MQENKRQANKKTVQLESSWLTHLQAEFDADYMQQLSQFLREEQHTGKTIFPESGNVFTALNTTPLDKVKVVILGQDPYHGPNQAHGLSFSVKPGVKVPPSLVNIYKELASDVGCTIPNNGYLLPWAEQGVLLLNSVLTVEQGNAGSHQGKGWEQFTDQVISVLNQQRDNLVFLLWGAYAQKKGAVIDRQRHLVLQAPHPSPLSAHRGFLGCKHFSQANDYLTQNRLTAVNWQI